MTVGQCSAPVRTVTTVCLALALWATPARAQLLGGLSEQEEVELGRAAVEEMEKELDLLTDATVTTYISELGLTLAQHSQRSQLTYVFKVVDSREINAFALPGGFIYVNRGLIETAETETELAGVLGHEIGHVVARHGAEQAQRASIANLGLRVLGSIFGSGTGGQIGGMAAELVTAGTFMRFSRDAEREADQLGAKNVAAAGHDPHGMVTFFEKLAALRDGQANAVERFFASHPSPEERVSNVQGLVGSLTAGRELTKDTARFRDIKSRLENLPPSLEPEAEPGAKAGAVPPVDAGGSSSDVIDARYNGDDRDHAIAARLAPVFRQALGSSARYDYITRVDFDGDWRGDNNWDNAERYPLPATVYYSVSETETHYFVHYATFHPRDYKGGNVRGVVLSEIIREGAERHGDYDPTGLSQSAVLAHENDMEGALVVAEKPRSDLHGTRVVYVETLAHNKFFRYAPAGSARGGAHGQVMLDDEHPVLYIEPKGHGVEAYRQGIAPSDVAGFINYRYSGEAEEASATRGEEEVGYELVSLVRTLWPRAQRGAGLTYGGTFDYRSWTVRVAGVEQQVTERDLAVGPVGSTFNGTVGGRNMARPPWGWFDRDEEDRRQGEWFFAPAETIKRHFALDEAFSTAYVHHPVFGIYRR